MTRPSPFVVDAQRCFSATQKQHAVWRYFPLHARQDLALRIRSKINQHIPQQHDVQHRHRRPRGNQVLLSMRELGAIGLLDLDRQVFTWALRGPWVGQHDPDLLPNGNMLLFDNYGHYGAGGTSRVIEFDPTTLELVWSYSGGAARPRHGFRRRSCGIRRGETPAFRGSRGIGLALHRGR